MIQFEIKGAPIPWKRPGRNNKTGAIFDQQKLQKEQLRWYLKDRFRQDIIKGPIGIKFSFYFPIPKETSGPRKRDMLHGVLHHMSRPDVDNLAKFYLDMMTSVIYEDDGQVCKLGVEKLYATEPYTLIEIEPKHCDMKKQTEVKEVEGNEDDSRDDGRGKLPRVIAFRQRDPSSVSEQDHLDDR